MIGRRPAGPLALARVDEVRRVAFIDLPDPAADLRIREKLPLLAQPTLLLQARDDLALDLPAIAAELSAFLSA